MAIIKRHANFSEHDQAVKKKVAAAEFFFQKNEFEKCISLCQATLKIQPDHLTLLELLALSLLQSMRVLEAEQTYNRILQHFPENFLAHLNLAKIYINEKKPETALPHLEHCIESSKMLDESIYLKAMCHEAMGEWPKAIDLYSRVIEVNGLNVQAYVKLAYCMAKINHLQEALQLLDTATQIFPESQELLIGKALILRERGFHAGALAAHEQVSKLNPVNPDYIGLHAEQLSAMKHFQESIKRYQEALVIDPNHIYSLSGVGIALLMLKEYEQAELYFQKILKINPNHEPTLINLSSLEMSRRDLKQAWKYSERLFDINKNFAGQYLYQMCFHCDWDRYGEARKSLENDTHFSRANAFQPVIFSDDPVVHLGYAKKNALQFKSSNILGEIEKYECSGKIRIGYYSCDFYAHATTMLMEALFRTHDRSRFELHAFSLDLRPHDAYNQRIRSLFDHFHDVHHISDRAVAHLSRQIKIDIAIDLKGYTEGSRTGIFAERAAPIQINFLGFPGSMGADFIDYIIADHCLIPQETRSAYSEKVIYLPHCYQPNNPDRPRPRHGEVKPAELPSDKFVYASFNNAYKITPAMFDTWMSILRSAPDSVLWLLSPPPEGKENLQAEAKHRGVEPSRLIFAPYLPEGEHLNRLQHADLFLDSFPCNAHTSASDALWAGVPLVTLQGKSFASRVASSLLQCAGLSELIFDDIKSYHDKAVEIYLQQDLKDQLRYKLKKAILEGKLYDIKDYVQHYEQALERAHEAYRNGSEFIDIDISV